MLLMLLIKDNMCLTRLQTECSISMRHLGRLCWHVDDVYTFTLGPVNGVGGGCASKLRGAAGGWHCMAGCSAASACMHLQVDSQALDLATICGCPKTPKLPVNGSR